MMKRIVSAALTVILVFALIACGGTNDGQNGKQAPDLQQYYDDFMASLGDNAPMMMTIEGDMLEAAYPGLSEYTLKQSVMQMAGISAVAYEMALVEAQNETDAQEIKTIFQDRVDSQIKGGAMYPATIEAWENASVIQDGNVVALIVAGEDQTAAVDAFNALFV